MTVETTPSQVKPLEPVPQEEPSHGLIANGTARVAGLYGKMKNSYPIVKTGFETVESRIPHEWIERVRAVSDPVVEGIDTRLDRGLSQIDKLRTVRADYSKKAVVRIEQGITLAKDHTPETVKDLLKYGEQAYGNATLAAQPYIQTIAQKLAEAQEKLNHAMAALQEARAKGISDVQAYMQHVATAARELSATSITYVQQKYSTTISKLPEHLQLAALVKNLPEPVLAAVNFILSSPQLFLEAKNKADLSGSLVSNTKNLLSAVKEVLLGEPAAPEAIEASAEGESEVERGDESSEMSNSD